MASGFIGTFLEIKILVLSTTFIDDPAAPLPHASDTASHRPWNGSRARFVGYKDFFRRLTNLLGILLIAIGTSQVPVPSCLDHVFKVIPRDPSHKGSCT